MTRKAKDHQYLWYRGGRKMPGKSGRDDENKKSSKKNQYRTQETKRNQYVNPPPQYESPPKEKGKGKTASVCSDPLGRERAAASGLLWRFGTSRYL